MLEFLMQALESLAHFAGWLSAFLLVSWPKIISVIKKAELYTNEETKVDDILDSIITIDAQIARYGLTDKIQYSQELINQAHDIAVNRYESQHAKRETLKVN